MELVSKAVEFAVRAHDGMMRKADNTPYILHPMEAATIVGSMTNDEEIIAAAVLHDVVEDTDVEMPQLEKLFGKRVADIVAAETENKMEHLPRETTWRIRKEEAVARLKGTTDVAVKMVFLGDKLANIRSVYRGYRKTGDAFWEYFNQKDPKEHGWYYRAVADAMPELMETSAWKEYDRLIRVLFEDAK